MVSGQLIVGVDGGGSRTRAAVLDHAGAVLGTAEQGASNPLVVGFEKGAATIVATVDEAVRAAGCARRDVVVFGIGVAGAGSSSDRERPGERLAALLREELGESVSVWSDREAALAGAFGGAPGIVVIAGTGSSAIGFDGRRVATAGGYGKAIGERGSGFEVVRAAALAALACEDRTSDSTTRLETDLAAGMGLGGNRDLVCGFAAGLDAERLRRGIAVVHALAKSGDRVADAILTDAGNALSELVAGLVATLAPREPLAVVGMGGLLDASRPVRQRFQAALLAKGLPAEIAPARASPETGAAWLAIAHWGGRANGVDALARALAAQDAGLA